MLVLARCTTFSCFNSEITPAGFTLDDSSLEASGTLYVYRTGGNYVSSYLLKNSPSSLISFGTSNTAIYDDMMDEFAANKFVFYSTRDITGGTENTYHSTKYPDYSLEVQLRDKSTGLYLYVVSIRVIGNTTPAMPTNWSFITKRAISSPKQKTGAAPQKLSAYEIMNYAKCTNADCFRNDAKDKNFIYSYTTAASGKAEKLLRFYGKDSILVDGELYPGNYAGIAIADNETYTRMEFATDAKRLYDDLMAVFGPTLGYAQTNTATYKDYKLQNYASTKYPGYKLETQLRNVGAGMFLYYIAVTTTRSAPVIIKKEVPVQTPVRTPTGAFLTIDDMYNLADCSNYECVKTYLGAKYEYRSTDNGTNNDGKNYSFQTVNPVYGEKDHATNNLVEVYVIDGATLIQVKYATDNKAEYQKLLQDFIGEGWEIVDTDKVDDGEEITYNVSGNHDEVMQVRIHKSKNSDFWLYTITLQVEY